MSAHQLPDGRWYVQWRDEGGKRRREYFGRGPDAERAARQRNHDLGLGSAGMAAGPTFADLAEQYFLARYGLSPTAHAPASPMSWRASSCRSWASCQRYESGRMRSTNMWRQGSPLGASAPASAGS